MSDLSDSQTGRTESDSPNACRRCAGTSTGNRALSVHVEHRCDKGGGGGGEPTRRARYPTCGTSAMARKVDRKVTIGWVVARVRHGFILQRVWDNRSPTHSVVVQSVTTSGRPVLRG